MKLIINLSKQAYDDCMSEGEHYPHLDRELLLAIKNGTPIEECKENDKQAIIKYIENDISAVEDIKAEIEKEMEYYFRHNDDKVVFGFKKSFEIVNNHISEKEKIDGSTD